MDRVLLSLGILAIASIGLASGMNFSGMMIRETREFQPGMPELSTDGYAKVNIEMGERLAQLSDGCISIMIFMEPEQAHAIAMGIQKLRDSRPSAHDIFGDTIDTFGIKLLMVRVERAENLTYYADMLMIQNNRLLILDSRPSDAIAMAVREGAPVYVKQALMEENGINTC
jgi:bifunctional DNase/RNase